MSYLVKMEEESVRKQLGAKGLKVDRKSGKVVPELKGVVHQILPPISNSESMNLFNEYSLLVLFQLAN